MFPANDSRKLTGLYITLGALFACFFLGSLAIYFLGIGESLVGSFGGYILGGGTAHQGAQMMADRSPAYPNVNSGQSATNARPAIIQATPLVESTPAFSPAGSSLSARLRMPALAGAFVMGLSGAIFILSTLTMVGAIHLS